ncbi:tetratricopeptide repeat-containing sulfotransferase family protein [Emcibacter nanhaiensis]|nr:tetratricopeptide repeat-containing sulfotransferase family protein [Emcibacter nanhaiensis]
MIARDIPDTGETEKMYRMSANIGLELRRGDLAQASILAEEIVRSYPRNARSWLAAAQVASRRGDRGAAIQNIGKSIDCFDADGDELAVAAKYFAEAGLCRKARICADKVTDAHCASAFQLDLAGNAYTLCGDHGSAKRCFERAAEEAPSNAGLLFNLAAAQRFSGDVAAAEASFERVIALNPDHYEAHHGLASIRRQTRGNNHIDRLKGMLEAAGPDWRGKVMLGFALGKELEDIGDFGAAFTAYTEAALLKRAQTHYSLDQEIGAIEQIIKCHRAEAFRTASPGRGGANAIFVLGLPRTGTTLVEQILAAHPYVGAKGELNDFASAMMSELNSLSGGVPIRRVQAISDSLKLDFAQLGERYLSMVAERAPDSDVFIDKMPLNYLYIGLILQALPEAHIIYLKRDPLDAATAIYTTLFNQAYAWSYSLQDIERYMQAHYRLMDHWKAEFGDRLYVVAYEDIIKDQEGATRGLLDYCGLPWDPACLDFHKNRSAVTTASAVQVRKPIYSTSMGRWKHFETELAPIVPSLQAISLIESNSYAP